MNGGIRVENINGSAITIQIVNQSFKSVAFAQKESLVNAMHALQELKVSRQMNESVETYAIMYLLP